MLTNIILLNKFSLHWLWIDPNPTHLHKHKLSQIVELLFQSCNRYFLQSPQYRKLNCIRFTHNSISQDYKIQTKEIFLIFFLKSGKHVGSIDLPNLNSISLKKGYTKWTSLIVIQRRGSRGINWLTVTIYQEFHLNTTSVPKLIELLYGLLNTQKIAQQKVVK